MEKQIIKNRHGLKIVTQLEQAENPAGLAIVVHGLYGSKDQAHVEVFAQAFKDANYTVLRYDATHSFGESDGPHEDATTTGYYQDLEDVINWAKDQNWYIEPFVLAGHSLGGLSIILYAEKFPDKIKALAPISTAVSGELMKKHYAPVVAEWKKKGFLESEHKSKPGVMKKLKWGFVEDGLKYDVLPESHKLKMPVLLIVGDRDMFTPIEDHQLLLDKLSGPKELHIIKGSKHCFRAPEYLKEVKEIFDNWIKKI